MQELCPKSILWRAFRGGTAIFLLAGTSGCLSVLFASPKVKSDGYEFAPLPAPWRKIDPGTSDAAYQFAADHSMISVNSVCGQYQDQTLEELTKGVTLGLTTTRIAAVDKLEAGGFPAERTTIEGMMGTEPVTVSLTVVRSDRCVYDFMLVARRARFAEHFSAFQDAVNGFAEETRR